MFIFIYYIAHLFEDSSVGLYRDDGWSVLRDLSRPKTERLRKHFVKIFKDYGFSITSKTNLKIVDYLDVTFDFQSNSYKPYRKPEKFTIIHTQTLKPSTNNPNELPKSIAKRIPDFSSSENIFHDAIFLY